MTEYKEEIVRDANTVGGFRLRRVLVTNDAPDLLEAAQALHDACEYWENQDDPILVDIRQAIAKAKGRQEA